MPTPAGITLLAPLPDRVVQVLKDFLADELALIDIALADGITTPPILDENFFPRDRRVIGTFPAVTIRMTGAHPVEVRPIRFGSRTDAKCRVLILVHVTSTQGDAETLQNLMARYAAGVIRTLCIQHERLDTIEDAGQFVEIVEWLEPLQFSPPPEQKEGAIVRTVTIPLSIRRREVREGA